MASRLQLQSKLEELLGTNNVYYQSPASINMNYPAIVYSKNKIDIKRANNSAYLMYDQYTIIVIDKRPDNPVIKKILCLPNAEYDRLYISDNLYHDVITLYY